MIYFYYYYITDKFLIEKELWTGTKKDHFRSFNKNVFRTFKDVEEKYISLNNRFESMLKEKRVQYE